MGGKRERETEKGREREMNEKEEGERRRGLVLVYDWRRQQVANTIKSWEEALEGKVVRGLYYY